MVRILLAVIALLPSVAEAQSSDPLDLAAMTARFYDREHEADFSAHVSAAGQAGTRYSGPVVAAGAAVAWSFGACRILHLGAEGTLQGDVSSGALVGGVCVPSPLFRVALTVRTDYQLQPRLAAMPVVLRSRYTGTSVEATAPIVVWSGLQHDHEIMPVAFRYGTIEQPGLDEVSVSAGLQAYRRVQREEGRAIDVLAFEVTMAGPERRTPGHDTVQLSTIAFELIPVSLSKLPVGEVRGRALELDLAAGFNWAGVGTRFLRTDLYAAWSLRATRRRATDDHDKFAVSMRRAYEPTFVDEMLHDTRASAAWTWRRGEHELGLAGFAAYTRRLTDVAMVAATPTGGGGASYTRRLRYGVRVTVAAEVARSFFATLDDALAREAVWSGQATASIGVATGDD